MGAILDPASERDLERYLVLEKDGAVLGVSFYGVGEARLRGLKVRVASCHVTSGENDWHKGGLDIYDLLKPAALANLGELGYPIAMTHEEVIGRAAARIRAVLLPLPRDRTGGELSAR